MATCRRATLINASDVACIPRRVQRLIDAGLDHAECWMWDGATANGGRYSNVSYATADGGRRNSTAHRLIYVLTRGPVPADMTLDHICRQTLCVNPWHLEITTQRANNMRGGSFAAMNALKTHCPLGHALTDDNLVPSLMAKGSRACMTCQRERDARITQAAHALGMSRREYAAIHGWSAAAAAAVIEATR